jgi:hypothetical protein
MYVSPQQVAFYEKAVVLMFILVVLIAAIVLCSGRMKPDEITIVSVSSDGVGRYYLQYIIDGKTFPVWLDSVELLDLFVWELGQRGNVRWMTEAGYGAVEGTSN